MNQDANYSEEELISNYFKQGYSNKEIMEFLKLHGVVLSLSTLKRRLRNLGLRRRFNKEYRVPDDILRVYIECELAGSGCFVGYRNMWARLRKRGMHVERERVMKLLRDIDPEGKEKDFEGEATMQKDPTIFGI